MRHNETLFAKNGISSESVGTGCASDGMDVQGDLSEMP